MHFHRLGRSIAFVAAASLAALAWAGPEDDYKTGAKAFKSGDIVASMEPLRRAADAGHAQAQALYAYILDRSDFNDDAVAYYRKAVAQGDTDAEFGLATMYAAGEGVKRDLAEARKLFLQAADKGHRDAINVLALAYMKGGLGLEEEERKSPAALRWINRAADNDHVPAVRFLAEAYRTGALGLTPDAKHAEQLEARAKKLAGVPEPAKGRRGAKK